MGVAVAEGVTVTVLLLPGMVVPTLAVPGSRVGLPLFLLAVSRVAWAGRRVNSLDMHS